MTIEVSEENYHADLAAGIDEDDTLKPGRYRMKSYIESIPFGEKRAARDVVKRFPQYSILDILRSLFELSQKGIIKFDREIANSFDIGAKDQFEPSL